MQHARLVATLWLERRARRGPRVLKKAAARRDAARPNLLLAKTWVRQRRGGYVYDGGEGE